MNPIEEVVAKAVKAAPETLPTKKAGLTVLKVRDYPKPGLTTLATSGGSELTCSMWRGLPVGFELTLTIAAAHEADGVRDLANIVIENARLASTKERRPPVEFNGVFAPGYAPHFFFCADLSLTPALSGRKKAGSRYADFLAAIPITDAELRDYDRGVPALIAKLRAADLGDYARR